MKKITLLLLLLMSNWLKAEDTLYLSYPDIAFEGISTDIQIHPESSVLPDYFIIEGDTAFVEKTDDGATFSASFSSKSDLDIKGYHIISNEQPSLIPLWMSILPPLLAIILALVFKEVVFSLVSGIFLGGAILGFYAEGFTGIFTGFFKIIDTYIIGALNDSGHLSVIVFSTIIGGIVALISKNGGMQGIVNSIVRFANNARNGQLATWFLGIAIFFDDYANTLVVGNTMRAITDKLKISREKLSYIVDSTAAPVSAIAFVTTWIGAELGYISKGLDNINADGTVIQEGVYSIFLNSLAYSFYPILTLFFIFYLVYRGRDFGSMLKAERRARSGGVVNPEVNSGDLTELEDVAPVKGIKYRAFNAVIPVSIIVFGTLVGLVITGFDTLSADMMASGIKADSWGQTWSNLHLLDPNIDSFTRRLGTLIGAADSYISLLWSSLLALFVAMMLTIGQKILNLKDTVETTIAGFKTMVPALLILILAWSLAMVTEEMHTADFLTDIMEGNIPYWLIPAITFVLSGFVAFSTGSSWSTMALVYPIILPAAWQICTGDGMATADSMAIFYNTVSAVLAGSVLGDHCSPISDTTILSSLASGCNHIDHVRTQIPYALTVGAVSVVLGTIPSALGLPAIFSFILSMGALVLIIEFIGKKVE
ncbi:MAG: Na+/H+ antiporter NhaC family protein [Crocinitomicaceae bacterium]|nr:Na+/H+ antiporter NhaC family protein [Crocinitomicaceae bacterium]